MAHIDYSNPTSSGWVATRDGLHSIEFTCYTTSAIPYLKRKNNRVVLTTKFLSNLLSTQGMISCIKYLNLGYDLEVCYMTLLMSGFSSSRFTGLGFAS